MAGKPVPKDCILNNFQVAKIINGRKLWSDADKSRYFQWDSMHGEIEVYNSRGRHIAVWDCHGTQIKGAVKGRSIDV